MRAVELTKCCRPNCNTYGVGLDNVRPCDACAAQGVRPVSPPMRPTHAPRSDPRVTLRDVVEAFRKLTPEDMNRAADRAEKYARAGQRIGKLLRRVVR